jgi:hypothetical protein
MKGFQRYSLIDNVDYKRSRVNKERMIDILREVNKSQRIINKEKRYILKGRREIREEKKIEEKNV